MVDRRRRRLLRTVIGMAGAGLALTAGARADDGRRKLTQKEAEYQATPKDIRMCATCAAFEPPAGCKTVEGDVSAEGWCKLFEMVD